MLAKKFAMRDKPDIFYRFLTLQRWGSPSIEFNLGSS
jgi:hypothetical protein